VSYFSGYTLIIVIVGAFIGLFIGETLWVYDPGFWYHAMHHPEVIELKTYPVPLGTKTIQVYITTQGGTGRPLQNAR
jgi:hypothetical protein